MQAKERQRSHGETAPGKKKSQVEKLPQVNSADSGKTRDQVAEAVGVSGKEGGGRMNSITRKPTAFHEAGHAVAAAVLRRPFRHVTIVPNEAENNLGHILYNPLPSWVLLDFALDAKAHRWFEREIMITLSGPAAEAKLLGHPDHVGASSDYSNAAELALKYFGSPGVAEKFLDYMMARAEQFITGRIQWLKVGAVAEELLRRERLTAHRVRQICDEAMIAAMKTRQDIRHQARSHD